MEKYSTKNDSLFVALRYLHNILANGPLCYVEDEALKLVIVFTIFFYDLHR